MTRQSEIQPHALSSSQKPHQWHEQKHIRAFLSDKPRAITYGLNNLLRRDPEGKKPIVVLIDGDRALEKTVHQAFREQGVEDRLVACVLDFIHLLEYVRGGGPMESG